MDCQLTSKAQTKSRPIRSPDQLLGDDIQLLPIIGIKCAALALKQHPLLQCSPTATSTQFPFGEISNKQSGEEASSSRKLKYSSKIPEDRI